MYYITYGNEVGEVEISKETLIRTSVHEMILTGELQYGDRLPSENQLADKYQAKRIDARNALVQLEKMGIVHSMQGVGRFVNEPLPTIDFTVTGATSFSHKMEEQNIPYESKIIFADYANAKEHEDYRAYLNLQDEDKIFKVSRLRIVDGLHCAIHISYIKESIFPKINEEKDQLTSVYSYFEAKGFNHLVSKERTLSAQFATLEEMEQLDCSELVPLLVFETGTYDKKENQVLEKVKILYRSDLFKHQLSDER